MSRPSFSNRNSYIFSNRGSQVSNPSLPRYNASPFLPPILAPPNLSYRRSVESLPRIGPPQGFIAMPFPPMTFLPPEMVQVSQKKKRRHHIEEGIEKVIGAIDQQSNILQTFAKAFEKKKEDHEKNQTKHLKNNIEKIKKATTLHQLKVDSQQDKLFNRILASHNLHGRASKNSHDSDSSEDSSLDRLTNAVYTHKIKTILQKKKKKLQQKNQQNHPIGTRRVTLKDDSVDADSKNSVEYDGGRRYNTERGSMPLNTPRTNHPVRSILINSPLKIKKKVEFDGVVDYEDSERFVRLSDRSPLKARILERRNVMERNRARVI